MKNEIGVSGRIKRETISQSRKQFQGSAASVLWGVARVARCAFATLRAAFTRRVSPQKATSFATGFSLFSCPRHSPLSSTFLWPLASSLLLCFFLSCGATFAQTETATVSGLITDESGAIVAGADVQLLSVQQGTTRNTKTNSAGLYIFPSIQPGMYQIKVNQRGFKQVDILSLIVNVQDHIEQNVRLQLGSVTESVTVNADDLHINTQDASVSTVVDRRFVENLPMNGRSFQTLIQLTPGVVLTPSSPQDAGQFSVNGQRASSNYWTIDGVSANIGMGTSNSSQGNGAGGVIGGFSAQGGTNSLVSIDALQEFRIQTSTFAPEFGRAPGAQISIVTRSGTNQFHGTAFDYLRNDVLDANDWFANSKRLARPEERQNDFGGTFSGPVFRDRTFFFFSYEGLRLRLPTVGLSVVPSVAVRQGAKPTTKPFLNAFPLPNGTDHGDGTADFNATFSNASTLDATSIRIDHRVGEKVGLFGRYNYSPSELHRRQRLEPSTISDNRIATQTLTLGLTWTASPQFTNDLRLNYSRNLATGDFKLDNFGGAIPLTDSVLALPSPFTTQDSFFAFDVFVLGAAYVGKLADNLQRQLNLVDSLSWQKGSHLLKFGADYRRLAPTINIVKYSQFDGFFSMAAAESGNLGFASISANRKAPLILQNLGIFAQDSWKVNSRLTLVYGVRWDVDFAPTANGGTSLVAVTNFGNVSALALAPSGTPVFSTRYTNFAPRLGLAYKMSRAPGWESVVRGGVGVFYDLATQDAGQASAQGNYPFGAAKFVFGGSFPLDSATAAPPVISPSGGIFINAFDPNLELPYTLQWHATFQQELGDKQSVSGSYIGSAGHRLLQTAVVESPNPTITSASLIGNYGTSSYNAFQLQFQRQLSRGLQTLGSYTWSHSIDTASASSYGNPSNVFVSQLGANENRGPSDFDVRHALSIGATYEVPTPNNGAFMRAVLGAWSLQNVFQARTAPPLSVLSFYQIPGSTAYARTDIVSGIPVYLYGSQYPGGKILNNTPNQGGAGCMGPFCAPPTDSNGIPLRQGNSGRNAFRGFGAWQWDFAVHRDFAIDESVKLQFRAEMFNVLNHPNFANPAQFLGSSQFGQSTQMLGAGLNSGNNDGGGSFSTLYQLGGPRSIQFALKLIF
jgi:hypothetical protein